jgi:hypothetical protein
MNEPDGPEQREADAAEYSERESDRIDAIEDRADSDLMAIAQARITAFFLDEVLP